MTIYNISNGSTPDWGGIREVQEPPDHALSGVFYFSSSKKKVQITRRNRVFKSVPRPGKKLGFSSQMRKFLTPDESPILGIKKRATTA